MSNNDELTEEELEKVLAGVHVNDFVIDKAIENQSVYRQQKIDELKAAKEELLKQKEKTK